MHRIGRHVSVFLRAHRMPFSKSNRAPVAAARGPRRSALLLSAVYPVRKLIVRNHVIKLRGRLVVPGTPGRAAIHADRRALIGAQQNNPWIFRIDPHRMVIVPARRAFDRRKICSGVRRPVRRCVADINRVLVVWRHAHPGEVEPAAPDPVLVIYLAPGFSRVIRTVQSADFRIRIHQRVQTIRTARRNSKTDASEPLFVGRQTRSQRFPGVATVYRLEQPARMSLQRPARRPRWPPRRPHICVQDLGIRWIEREVRRSGVLILV